MPGAAMCALRLCSTEQIDLSRYRFHVVRVHAPPIPTPMIKIESFGNLSHQHLVDKPMGEIQTSPPDLTVPAQISRTCPVPASGDYAFADVPVDDRITSHRLIRWTVAATHTKAVPGYLNINVPSDKMAPATKQAE